MAPLRDTNGERSEKFRFQLSYYLFSDYLSSLFIVPFFLSRGSAAIERSSREKGARKSFFDARGPTRVNNKIDVSREIDQAKRSFA
jgi:hypothetical protein